MAKAPTKQPGKALVNWEEKFAGMAKDSTKGIELPTAKWLSIRAGVLTYGGAEVPDNELRCIILGWTYENQLYEGRFDPKNPSSPVCYAFGTDPDEMAPHEKSEDPKCESCAECPYNEWPEGGGAKECKNVVRLALIAESDLEDLDAAEVAYLKVPVTSVKNFKYYVAKELRGVIKRPLWAVVTNIIVEASDETQVKVRFELGDKIEDSQYFEQLDEMFNSNMESIGFAYPPNGERQERLAARGKGKGAVKGKAAPSKPAKFAKR